MQWAKVLNVVDCHAEGERNKVVVGGLGNVPGATMFDKRNYLQDQQDDLRKLLLFEPRGSVLDCVNFVLPATDPAAVFGYVIAESTEYPAMSGSNTICVATVLLEMGMVPMTEPVTTFTLEAPAGLIHLRCECAGGKVTSVRFTNQPSFVFHLDARLDVPGLGELDVAVSYGGMIYVHVDAAQLGLALVPQEARRLCELGQAIKAAAFEQLEAVHPLNPELRGVTQTQFMGPLRREHDVLVSRNAVIVSPGRVDRSPCGTGTSARLALMHARGEIEVGETFVHESLIGTRFDSRIEETTTIGKFPAIVPSVAGQAWISGIHLVGLNATDPFPEGFTLPDIWGA